MSKRFSSKIIDKIFSLFIETSYVTLLKHHSAEPRTLTSLSVYSPKPALSVGLPSVLRSSREATKLLLWMS